ncbi:hypothetical protein [Caulobacter endophyticus]|uniref:hypothetical protein n=1 Tax=Caulobacter endophyticus TaxID=2172652 RepID=UPI00241086A4|nr:hypothetical protein [Caulobacter endophyticus]MDG2527746.1 hypothetical protein [Caulobacter endophyticus]
MTIRVEIRGQPELEKLVALLDSHDVVQLVLDGKVVAEARRIETPVRKDRVPGALAHLGPMDDPDVFFHPDPEFGELAESHDEDTFYRPPPSVK